MKFKGDNAAENNIETFTFIVKTLLLKILNILMYKLSKRIFISRVWSNCGKSVEVISLVTTVVGDHVFTLYNLQ